MKNNYQLLDQDSEAEFRNIARGTQINYYEALGRNIVYEIKDYGKQGKLHWKQRRHLDPEHERRLRQLLALTIYGSPMDIMTSENDDQKHTQLVYTNILSYHLPITALGVIGGIATVVSPTPAILFVAGIIGAASSIYLVARSIEPLLDNVRHRQPIAAFKNCENAFSWIGIIIGIFGTAVSVGSCLIAVNVISAKDFVHAILSFGSISTICGVFVSIGSCLLAEKIIVAQLAEKAAKHFGSQDALIVDIPRDTVDMIALAETKELLPHRTVVGSLSVGDVVSIINQILDTEGGLSYISAFRHHFEGYACKRKLLNKLLKHLSTLMSIFHNIIVPTETIAHLLVIFQDQNRCKSNTNHGYSDVDILDSLYHLVRESYNLAYRNNERPLIDLTENLQLIQQIRLRALNIRRGY
ncbi:hypothetical protein DdX_16476 [Ditylenchus destructor]|uniref:DUF4781 domain-containing protein n=1 Tax=Ditylenchus destructor TaxID=166010 RepID=A0AAD4MQ92_9BILA|nr:hypothetical protein DdX_16476 [Ditylenchus destructor]